MSSSDEAGRRELRRSSKGRARGSERVGKQQTKLEWMKEGEKESDGCKRERDCENKVGIDLSGKDE